MGLEGPLTKSHFDVHMILKGLRWAGMAPLGFVYVGWI